MRRHTLATGAGVVVLVASLVRADPARFETDRFTAVFNHGGALTELTDQAGTRLVGAVVDATATARLHRVGQDHAATTGAPLPGATQTWRYTGLNDLPGGSITSAYAVDPASGDLVVTQLGQSPQKGVWGVSWSIAGIPFDFNIVLPGHSGIKVTRTSPVRRVTLDYPIGWEAQLVIIEGQGHGFYVWADDAVGRFKRLTLTPSTDGWQLTLTTINPAPFDDLTNCDSVRWRLNVYEGDWRVPARRYRDWATANLKPTRIEDQRPAWVKDIRCCVIMGLDVPLAEALAKRLDPAQTLLYIPDWRQAGYDRDYPTYDAPRENLRPFLDRAHALGYRVMLHVNYFGCDPQNPLYAQFEPFQVRSPWGKHEKEWWLWTRANPIIKFAYINPSHKPWRDLFVGRMKTLCETFPVDALHLDQTLCIYNDHNGLIDGMTMMEGNIRLHDDLRRAIPDVALSGEGLDEVTYRHEAFAQRHSWGLDFVEGTWDRRALAMAHPISSYLLRPYTIIYGYLGCAPPTADQLYAAWNEDYQNWGVIPTLKPQLKQVQAPTGFSQQFFDEATFWLRERVDIDADSDWPPEVCFPYRTAAGERVVRTSDRRLLHGEREISRTISGVTEARLPGSVPGWQVYNDQRLFGFDPAAWYPYVPTPRTLDATHIAQLPAGFTATAVPSGDRILAVRTRALENIVTDLGAVLDEALCGTRPFDGPGFECRGPLSAADGGVFTSAGNGFIAAHPPWKALPQAPGATIVQGSGTGIAYARFDVELPQASNLKFSSDVYMDAGAVGPDKTDGVTFAVRAVTDGNDQTRAEIHNAATEPKRLELDLSRFAGHRVNLELSVHPGPARSATFDWARWRRPIVVQDPAQEAELVVVSTDRWATALSGPAALPVLSEGNHHRVKCRLPGAVFLVNHPPETPAGLPLDLSTAPFVTTFLGDSGQVLAAPEYAGATPGDGVVGGVKRPGLSIHPPNHGRTVLDILLLLPEKPVALDSSVGIQDGSTSEGVLFTVEANGIELARQDMRPGTWRSLTADLTPWAGKPVVLSLIVDSVGSFACDWARWGEPSLRVRQAP